MTEAVIASMRCARGTDPWKAPRHMNKQPIVKGSPSMAPFTCVFVSAIAYGVVLRLLDIYLLATATSPGFYDLWLGRYFGGFCLGDIVLATGVLFLIFSALGVVVERSAAAWMALGFCTILLLYTAALRILPAILL